MAKASTVVAKLDSEIAQAAKTNSSFGIKLGLDLFSHLVQAGRITMEPTRLRELPFWLLDDHPTLDKKYLVTVDPFFEGWDFHVGGRSRVNA